MILDNVRKDRDLFNSNPDAYERVSIRLEEILGNRKNAFMGEEFDNEPILTKEQ